MQPRILKWSIALFFFFLTYKLRGKEWQNLLELSITSKAAVWWCYVKNIYCRVLESFPENNRGEPCFNKSSESLTVLK